MTRLSLVSWMVLVGCGGPSTAEVFAPHQQRFAELATVLGTIASRLPPLGAAVPDACSAALDPKPVFDVVDHARNTVVFLSAQELGGADAAGVDAEVARALGDALPRESLRIFTGWAASGAPAEPAGARLAGELAETAQARWLVVQRVTRAERIVIDQIAKSFGGGGAAVEGFVFDLGSGELRCTYTLEPGPDAQVMVRADSYDHTPVLETA